MTTLLVLGLAGVVAMVAFTWMTIRAVFWLMFFPLMLLKAVFGMVFGLVFGALGLAIGLAVTVLVGVVG